MLKFNFMIFACFSYIFDTSKCYRCWLHASLQVTQTQYGSIVLFLVRSFIVLQFAVFILIITF